MHSLHTLLGRYSFPYCSCHFVEFLAAFHKMGGCHLTFKLGPEVWHVVPATVAQLLGLSDQSLEHTSK